MLLLQVPPSFKYDRFSEEVLRLTHTSKHRFADCDHGQDIYAFRPFLYYLLVCSNVKERHPRLR